MIQNILRHLGSIEHYGVVSLCLFGSVFLGVLIWTCLQKKSHLEYMSRVALDDALGTQSAGPARTGQEQRAELELCAPGAAPGGAQSRGSDPSTLDPQLSRTSHE